MVKILDPSEINKKPDGIPEHLVNQSDTLARIAELKAKSEQTSSTPQPFKMTDMREPVKETPASIEIKDKEGYEVKPVVTNLPGNVEDGWTRQQFLTKDLLYPEVHVRPMNMAVLKRLAAARAEEPARSFTMMLDALQNCISIDIRSLSVPDLYFFQYWLRLNSYPRSPLTIQWTSKYGNANISRISGMSNFEMQEISMTREELKRWQKEGISIPTVRDMEVLISHELSADDEWEIQYSQYMYVENIDENYLKNKIQSFHAAGLDVITRIDEFSNLIAHGVVEHVTCHDQHFDLDKAITYLLDEIEVLGISLSEIQKQEDTTERNASVLAIIQHLDSRNTLLKTLQTAKENNEEVRPEKEVVSIGLPDINMLFP